MQTDFPAPRPQPPDTDPLRTFQAAAVRKAACILRDNLASPPCLQELSRQVGLSHPLLNKWFHRLFGTTAYGYLRRLRLEKARRLLAENRTNVTDTAFSVGYESLPSFSRAFSLHFGICPRVFLAELRRKRPAEPTTARPKEHC